MIGVVVAVVWLACSVLAAGSFAVIGEVAAVGSFRHD